MAAYVIAQMAVHDVEMYRKYAMSVMQTIDGSGGRVLAANDVEEFEGSAAHPRLVIGEFPTIDAAKTWYESDAYQAIKQLRIDATTSVLFMVEGITLPETAHQQAVERA
jgi:uncharacterized protein (DUF1330 family)